MGSQWGPHFSHIHITSYITKILMPKTGRGTNSGEGGIPETPLCIKSCKAYLDFGENRTTCPT